MPSESVETVIIGGGQAGLVMSHMLRTRGRPHIVLERSRVAERWRSERWNGLRFQFPNWSVRLPDFPFPQSDPDGFAPPEEIVEYLERYARHIEAPVRSGVAATAVRRDPQSGRYTVETAVGQIEAKNVVIATGPYQKPVIPPCCSEASPFFQVHASQYKSSSQLPDGGVLVVGSGASGTQIAEELLREGRRVYISLGRHRRFPRRYRGKDVIWWLERLGIDRTPVAKHVPGQPLPLITGAYGGHTLDFRHLAAQGLTLLGHVENIAGTVVKIAPDLADSLAYGDAAYMGFLDMVDEQVDRLGLRAPEDPEARIPHPDPDCVREPLHRLDLTEAGVNAVIWATGYACEFSWIDVPVLNERGEPKHREGVTDAPGLYFIGLLWLARMNSSFLSGVAEDAERLAELIAADTSR